MKLGDGTRLTKKFYIKTFGCQMNVYDSQRMADVLAPLDFDATDVPEEADLVIVNTCHIREKAAEKLYSELGRLRLIKQDREKAGKGSLLCVAGCVAQAEGLEIQRRAPYVDVVMGPQTYQRLPQMLEQLNKGQRGVLDLDFPAEPKFQTLPETSGRGSAAFLTIQEGCDKFCTFCVVPYTRGQEYSRPAADILDEVGKLVQVGAREITLLGQNVNAYHGDFGGAGEAGGLGRLLRLLGEIPGLLRLRYTTSHPTDMNEDLIAAHGQVEALMPFLHLPIQSGSDKVLARMNRRHGVGDYRKKVDLLWQARPDLKLATDFIVGFPGETDEDFRQTLDLARDLEFIQAYSFKYSLRPGTPAADMEDQVPDTLKSERLVELQDLLNGNQTRFNRSCVGQDFPVLIDRPGRKPGQFAGRSPYMQPVHVTPADGTQEAALMGEVMDLHITAGHANSLSGVPVKQNLEGPGG